MELRKVGETAGTITLGWDPPPGVGGYVLYAHGQVVSVATRNLKDGTPRKTVKFSKTAPGPPFHVCSTVRSPSGIYSLDVGTYPKTPPPSTGYAPRSYNSTHSADARFCCSPEYGCRQVAGGWVDQQGIQYDESMRDRGGRSNNTANPIPELKGANSMDGKEPCDPYVGPLGIPVGGAAGYPPASFNR